MNSNDLVINTENLSRSFGEVLALKSLNLRVPQKSIFAFLGPNGAGKTTTIKLLLGLLKPSVLITKSSEFMLISPCVWIGASRLIGCSHLRNFI